VTTPVTDSTPATGPGIAWRRAFRWDLDKTYLDTHFETVRGLLRSAIQRADQKRAYYSGNLVLIDFNKVGCTRAALVKALSAEGVHASFWDYPEQHKLKIYSEAKWWTHPPKIPQSMPGNAYINANHLFLPLIYGEAPDLIAQYVQAFEKVWAHRTELAKA
jgi:perosamine synthetase